MNKKLLSVLLAAVMVLSVLSVAVSARNCETVTITNTTLWDDGSLKSMDVTFDWAPAGNEHLYVVVFDEHTESNEDESEYWWQYDEYSHTDPGSIVSSINDFAEYREKNWFAYGGSGSTPVSGNNTINVEFEKGTVPLNLDRNYSFVMFNGPDGTGYRPTDPLGTLKCVSSELSFENTSGSSADVELPALAHTHGSVTFEAWNDAAKLPDTAGNYYLDTDVTLNATWYVPTGETNLCLNGHVVKPADGKTGSVINIPTGATLKL